MGGNGKRRVGSSKSKKSFKQGLRKTFAKRHIDQVWEDVRKDQESLVTFREAGNEKLGPVGTTTKAVLDEDTPGGGSFYCTPCARYFVSDAALLSHSKTKAHKRRIKELQGTMPHTQKDADWAAGMGTADHGKQEQPLAGMEQ